jgi:hypothetical protein
MKHKFLIVSLALVASTACLCGLSACCSKSNETKEHQHDWDDGQVISEASCNVKGLTLYTCKDDSSHTKVDEITALTHDWDEGQVITNATCGVNGTILYTCKNDSSHTRVEKTPALTHDWDEGQVIKEATCTENGYALYTCKNDSSHTKLETVDVIPHSYVDGFCKYCNTIEPDANSTFGLDYKLSDDKTYYILSGIGSATDRNIVIPASYNGLPVTEIADNAFSASTTILSLTIPTSVTTIGYRAFFSCSNLTSVTIGESVTSIGEEAFYSCKRLVEIYNLSGLDIEKESGDNGFVGYHAIDIYESSDSKSSLHTSDDYIFYENGDIVYLIDYLGTKTELSLPDKYNNKNYGIYDYAFFHYSDLESITIPDGVTSIGRYAFGYCSSLNKITIPDSVTSIGNYAFCCCIYLTYVAIGNGTTSIGNSAFYNCFILFDVIISDSVTSIGLGAFRYCSFLTFVYYTGTSADWENISMGSTNSELASATIYYYSESQPTDEGNYWHYGTDGVTPVIW